MICSRYLENRDFTPQTYYRLKVTAEKDGTPFAAISELRYETLPAANAALGAVTATGTVEVADLQRREVIQEPPLLYDLTALQKEANGRYGFSADKTLSIAQSLYEKKVLSYPVPAPATYRTTCSTRYPIVSPCWSGTRLSPPMPPP